MANIATKEAVQISGFIVILEERLKHPLYIKYCVDGSDFHQENNMRVDESGDLVGKEQKLRFNSFLHLQEGSALKIQIYKKHALRVWLQDIILTKNEIPFDDIWRHVELPALVHPDSRFEVHVDPKKQIWLDVMIPPALKANSSALPRAPHTQQDVSTDPGQSSDALKAADLEIKTAMEKLKQFKSVLDRLGQIRSPAETMLKIGMAISELSPISRAVATCIGVAHDRLKAQDQSHKQMLNLTRSMANLVEHIQSIEKITKLDELKQTMGTFPALMKKTASFIEKWLDSWTAHSLFIASNKAEIDDLIRELNEFKEEFDRGLAVDTRVAQELKELRESLLGRIEFSSLVEECMQDTRIDILSDVDTKIDDREDNNMIWIKGFPGVGKSTLAASVVARLRIRGRLGSYFVFDRAKPTETTTNALWRHIAYDLARRYPSARRSILEQLQKEDVDINLPNITSLFTSLVEKPLLALSESDDIPNNCFPVFVIDAADECGGLEGFRSKDRKDLLQTLKRWPQCPKNFKLIVTSRPENDIYRTISSISTHINIPSGSAATEGTQASTDIRAFLIHHLKIIAEPYADSLPPDWPEKAANSLTPRAAGVFIWAATVVKFIEDGVPKARSDAIIHQGPGPGDLGGLYTLYSDVLETSFGSANKGELEAFKAVIGAMVFAKRPLQVIELTQLPGVSSSSLNYICMGLRSVIDQGDIPQFSHQSFVDFLLSSKCPDKFILKETEQQRQLSKLCLGAMLEHLRFNICGLKDSAVRNADVPDIDARVKGSIPPLLSYSCCFWTEHLIRTSFTEDLMDLLSKVIYKKLLYWFECMSLLEEMVRVPPALQMILDWSDPAANDNAFTGFIRDALRFIAAFGRPIAESAPHIYISALPFAPEHSAVVERFLPRFPHTIKFIRGRPAYWPLFGFISEYHKAGVSKITFSPDGKYFASGDWDGTIFICDSETGSLVVGPLIPDADKYENRDMRGSVQNITFSPDGKRIAAGYSNGIDGTVQIWDVESCGERLHLEGQQLACFSGTQHIVTVSQLGGRVQAWNADTGEPACIFPERMIADHWRVVFSPDGNYLAWCEGETQSLVRVWNLADGTCFREYTHSEWVGALTFSSDSHFVVSGSCDGVIIIWSMETGKAVDRMFVNHRVTRLGHSPRNQVLVSADRDTFTVWNTSTHEAVFRQTPMSWFWEVSLSHTDTRILVGDTEGTVRMWNLDSLGDSPVPHTADDERSVLCCGAAFSPCGKKLVSCSDDRTLRVWDAGTGKPLLEPIRAAFPVATAAFSPDGKYIVSGSRDDGTISIFDAETGQLAYQPAFEPQDGEGGTCHLFFRSTDQRLVTCSEGGAVRIWNEDMTAQEVRNIVWDPSMEHSEYSIIKTLAPDGLTAVIAIYHFNSSRSKDTRYSIRCTTTNECLHTGSDIFGDVAYSPSGKLLAYCSRLEEGTVLHAWETQSGDLVAGRSFRVGEPDDIGGLAISPDDRFIATSSWKDGAVRIWDARTGDLISGPWRGDSARAASFGVVFSPCGQKLASYSSSGIIWVWDTSNVFEPPQKAAWGFGDDSTIDDGWVISQGGSRLFWAPPEHREGLCKPRNMTVIGVISAKFDLTEFRYGKDWWKCIDKERLEE